MFVAGSCFAGPGLRHNMLLLNLCCEQLKWLFTAQAHCDRRNLIISSFHRSIGNAGSTAMRSASLIYPQAVFLAFLCLQAVTCLASQNLPVTSDSISTGAVSAQQQLSDVLAQLGRSQQQTATVLDAVSKGTITASKALSLLKDVDILRDALKHEAAAARTSTASKRSSDTPQQQQQEQQEQEEQQQHQPSRGILIVAGGSHQLKNAYILLKLLAHPDIACKLPVEIVYYGPHEYDAPTAATIIYHLADATGISVKFIDGSEVPPTGDVGLGPHKPPGRLTGFKAKVHALVWMTSFDHVSEQQMEICLEVGMLLAVICLLKRSWWHSMKALDWGDLSLDAAVPGVVYLFEARPPGDGPYQACKHAC